MALSVAPPAPQEAQLPLVLDFLRGMDSPMVRAVVSLLGAAFIPTGVAIAAMRACFDLFNNSGDDSGIFLVVSLCILIGGPMAVMWALFYAFRACRRRGQPELEGMIASVVAIGVVGALFVFRWIMFLFPAVWIGLVFQRSHAWYAGAVIQFALGIWLLRYARNSAPA